MSKSSVLMHIITGCLYFLQNLVGFSPYNQRAILTFLRGWLIHQHPHSIKGCTDSLCIEYKRASPKGNAWVVNNQIETCMEYFINIALIMSFQTTETLHLVSASLYFTCTDPATMLKTRYRVRHMLAPSELKGAYVPLSDSEPVCVALTMYLGGRKITNVSVKV